MERVLCNSCGTDILKGRYIKHFCCRQYITANFKKIFNKEKRDILAKAMANKYEITGHLFVDSVGSYSNIKDAGGKTLLCLDIDQAIVFDPELCTMLLSDFAHFISRLDENFLHYREYLIKDSHILLLFDFPLIYRQYMNIRPSENRIFIINRILSKALRAIAQLDILVPDQFLSFDILNPERIFISQEENIYFLFPLFHEKYLKYSNYNTISNQLNIFEKILENYPYYSKNRINFLEIFNIGWNLYNLLTEKAPEFEEGLDSKDSFPLRPSKINSQCTDYLEEIVMRSLFFPDSVPFNRLSDIHSFLTGIYHRRIKVQKGESKVEDFLSLARYYENISIYSPKKNRWMGQAYDIYHKLSLDYPDNQDILYSKAHIMYKTKQFDQAKNILSGILAKGPGNLQALLLLGYIYLDGYNLVDKSMECYRRIEKKLGMVPLPITMLKADILIKMQRNKEASDILHAIYKGHQNDPVLRQKVKSRLSRILV